MPQLVLARAVSFGCSTTRRQTAGVAHMHACMHFNNSEEAAVNRENDQAASALPTVSRLQQVNVLWGCTAVPPCSVLSCVLGCRDMTGQRNIYCVREGVKYSCSPDQIEG